MTHSPVKKTVAATAIAASTLGGIAAGATLFTPGSAGAQDDADPTTDDTTTDDTGAEDTDGARPAFGDHITEALQPLVDDGRLDAELVDDIIEALEAARPERGERGPGMRGHHGFGGGADIAEVLGLEAGELREALADGQSIAEVAEAQGVAVDDVVDAIVSATEERLADAVENGRIDEERAEEILSDAAERAEDMVNGELELGRRGPGRRGPGGFGFGSGFGPADAGDDLPAVNTTNA